MTTIRDGSDGPMYPKVRVRASWLLEALCVSVADQGLSDGDVMEFIREVDEHGTQSTLRRWFTVIEDDE